MEAEKKRLKALKTFLLDKILMIIESPLLARNDLDVAIDKRVAEMDSTM